jgi:methyl-accepting chemotaxis protein
LQQKAERQDVEARQRRAALLGTANTVEAETAAALEGIGIRTTAMTATADAMQASATRTGSSAHDAATAAGQALGDAQSVASAAEQLATSIRKIAGQMSRSTAVVGRALTAATEARTTIEVLNHEVEQIGSVADMIGEFAGRTNLLCWRSTQRSRRHAPGSVVAILSDSFARVVALRPGAIRRPLCSTGSV